MAFCDFCKCDTCRYGDSYLQHALTSDNGKYICDVCFLYDLCTSDHNPYGVARSDNPCENKNCKHRPKILSKWTKRI